MSWSVNIGSIAGTAIRVHFTFVLFLLWIFVASWASGGPAAAWNGLAFMLLLFACVLAHEFGHILVARAFGVPTPDVTLLPIVGVGFLMGAHLEPQHLGTMEDAHVSLIDRLAAVNLFLALFNMIPAFPMDGGRVLRALLAIRLGHVRATAIAAAIGQFVAFVLGFIGLFGNPILIFIAIFVYLAASSEAHLVAMRAMSRDLPVSAAMMTEFATLSPDDRMDAAVETLLRTSQSEFPVIDADGRLAGLLDRDGVIRALKTQGPDARVADAMATGIPTVGNRSRLEAAFRTLQETSAPAVGVVDPAGRLVGLITPETVGEMLMVQQALPKGAHMEPWSARPVR